MKIQRVAFALTLVNIAIMAFLLTQMRPAHAQKQRQNTVTVLRGRALEIVDSLGRIRASITLQPPVEVDGKKYPETVLLRLIESKGKPIVKLGAAENGAGLTLINQSDEGVLIHGNNDGSSIKIPTRARNGLLHREVVNQSNNANSSG